MHAFYYVSVNNSVMYPLINPKNTEYSYLVVYVIVYIYTQYYNTLPLQEIYYEYHIFQINNIVSCHKFKHFIPHILN